MGRCPADIREKYKPTDQSTLFDVECKGCLKTGSTRGPGLLFTLAREGGHVSTGWVTDSLTPALPGMLPQAGVAGEDPRLQPPLNLRRQHRSRNSHLRRQSPTRMHVRLRMLRYGP